MAEGGDSVDDCSICLQVPVFPTKLPKCGHTFCFLCIKGVALRDHKCPMCRSVFPASVFSRPTVIFPPKQQTISSGCSKNHSMDATGDDEENEAEEAEEGEIVDDDESEPEPEYSWFYEGRNGWWQYDQRTAQDIQSAKEADKSELQVMVAGSVYIIDLRSMVQYRKDEPIRKRRIRYQPIDGAQIKGVAGLTVITKTPKRKGKSINIDSRQS